MTLEEKVTILDRLRAGETYAGIAKTLGRNESTIRTIKSNEVKIRSAIIAGRVQTQKRLGNALIDRMENALIVWINDMDSKGIPLCE